MKFIKYTLLLGLNFIFTLADETIKKGPISTDGKCGPDHGNAICPGNECCNKNGECGFDIPNFCGDNCLKGYGYCLPPDHNSRLCLQCMECEDCEKNPFIALKCPYNCKKNGKNDKNDQKKKTERPMDEYVPL